ncbi:OmpP1/FadL family transporter [Pontibacter liquoris]|uniref:OmpP1/FadL family transporter n=1 Tax=Pontibacter liquoris TaxID=2905677 RepID=UPI001FA7518C|nr:hypothetical protein [Pontibacter liquoris]
MKLHKTFLASLALVLGWSGTAFAQNEVDALRYSRYGVSGSARIQGIGGAQTALGADISTMSVNPAGLGMFRRSEFGISPGLQFNNTQTSINGFNSTQDRNTLSIPQAGLVLSNHKSDEEDSDWRGASLGISLTRLNNFNQQLNYSNTTGETTPTIVEYFADQANANGRTLAELNSEFNNGFTSLEGLAFGTYLIDVQTDDNGQEFVTPLTRIGSMNQAEQIKRSGSQNQFDIGVGTSYRDKLYLGASLGIITTNFTQESIYTEAENSAETAFTGLELRDQFTTQGAGVNLRVGAIFRPIDAVRIGASVQTPTAYTLNDQYQRSLYASYDDGPTESASEIPGEFTYQLTTPFRANGGVAVFLNKYGFITADVEYVDYGSTRFHEQQDEYGNAGNYFTDVNNTIASTYKSAINYKIGAEGRYEVFRFRAGYGVSGDPYRNASFDGKVNSYSLGAGVRLQKYYLDAAFVSSKGNTRYSPYVFSNGGEPVVDIDQKQNTLLFTLGYNF